MSDAIYKIRQLQNEEFPAPLLEIPQPPKELWIQGELPSPEEYIYLAVVGTRKYTNYGKEVCEKLIAALRGHPIVIVSGLALGIDAIAHKAAPDAGLKTIAVPGSGLDPKVLYPSANQGLARKIVESGGCLLSEFAPDFRAAVWTFPQRNRIVAGMCKAVLVIEAPEKSGALITSRLATDYNRDVFTVPGSIFSENSQGPHMLVRLGATPIRHSNDLLEALGFEVSENETKNTARKNQELENGTPEEKLIWELLAEPCPRDDLMRKAGIPIAKANALLSIMEIKGLIKESLGEIRRA